jgi:hypothetical protein
MAAFSYARDLEHPVSAEVEQTMRDTLAPILSG